MVCWEGYQGCEKGKKLELSEDYVMTQKPKEPNAELEGGHDIDKRYERTRGLFLSQAWMEKANGRKRDSIFYYISECLTTNGVV